MTRGLVGLLPLMLIAALVPASITASEAPARADQASEPVGRTDRVLVRWSTRLSATAARAPGRLAALASATGRDPAFVRFTGSGAAIYDLGAPLGGDSAGILAALGRVDGVATVEPDLWMTVDLLPSDPRAPELWGLLGAADGSAYGIDVTGAWSTSTGAGVVVAVIDTGLVAHEDLAGQAVAGYDMIWDTAVANDGSGRDGNASDPGDWCGSRPSSWHGTHVAGTIAALSNNATGVFGGAPGVKIQPVRVLGTCGGYLSDVADGIRWAAGGTVPGVPANATPARVLNLSLGSTSPSSCPAEMSAAISDARSRGGIVVVAAGNDAADASLFAPANCDGVITVAATDQAGQRAFFSNYGSVVELSAPGVAILSTVDSGTTVPAGSAYVSYRGTSMATPHVALSAALVAAAAPGLTPAQIAAILADTSTPVGPDTSAEGCPALGCGTGIVHAARAVASLDTTPPTGTVSINGGAAATTSAAVSVDVSASDPSGVSQVRISNNPAMAGAETRAYATPQSWTLAAGADGTRTVYVQWQDSVGNWSGVSSDSITLVTDTAAPTGGVSINGGAAATTSAAVSVDVSASDPSGVSEVRISNDPAMEGAVTSPYATPQTWTLAAGADGGRTVYVQWRDGVGNWSAVSSDSITLDTIVPARSAPAASLASGIALDSATVPVRLAWSGSDAGSGLARFELAQSTNGGAWAALALPSPTARTLWPLLRPGNASYRFRVRAIDAAGNASAWANGPIFRVRKVQESSTAIRYAGTWSRVSATAALGGRYRSTRVRASATYTFTGRSIAWVANRGTAFGAARVYIDGVYRGTVNLRAPSTLWRRIVFSRAWATSGRHTIRIVGSATRGHPRVSLDAFVVLQ